MPFEYYFPKLIYFRDQLLEPAQHQQLLTAVQQIRHEFPTSTRKNLYTTYGNIANLLERPGFGVLQQALRAEVALYLAKLETRAQYRVEFSDAWVSISAPGNYERMHTHDGAYVSGVYYLQCPPACGAICFEELSDNLWASQRQQQENWNAVTFDAVEGRLLLFNSKLPHAVGQNCSDDERIALSFNVILM